MPQPLNLLIFIVSSDETFAPWRWIFQVEARSPGISGARVVVSEPGGEGLVDKTGVVRLLRSC